jgi:hypothetical protein
MLRHVMACLAALLALVTVVSARDVTPGINTGEISGVVIGGDASRRPARDTLVMLAGTDVGLIRVSATDAKGRFAFTGLPAGRFLLGAGKPAYVTSLYGARRVGRPGEIIVLTPGQKRRNTTLTLARGAVIAGRITDDDGQPLPGARVRVMQRRAAAGEVSLTGDLGDPAAATTDERGLYRIYDLPPGEYAVAVQPRNTLGSNVRVLTAADIDEGLGAPAPPAIQNPPPATAPISGYAPVYYPGTTLAVQAEAITLVAGEERTDVDLRAKLVRLVRVEGSVASDAGTATQAIQLTLRPSGQAATGVVFNSFTVRAAPDGHFTFAGVPPGDYTAFARTLPPPANADPFGGAPPPDAPQWAMAQVTVAGENSSSLALKLRPGLTLSGRVVFAGAAKPQDLIGVRVGIRPTPASGLPSVPDPATVEPTGSFTLAGLLPGKYRLFVLVPSLDGTQIPDWSAKAASVHGVNALDVPFEVTPDERANEAVLTLTADMQQVTGTVRDAAGRPLRDQAVVVFSADRRFWFAQSRWIALRFSHADGQFAFGAATALPPGDYYAAALPDIAPNEQFDPDLLAELAATSLHFTLRAGTTETLDLRIKRER